jgi:hypothetical protein
MISGELMDEDEGCAAAGFLVVQLDAIICACEGHDFSPGSYPDAIVEELVVRHKRPSYLDLQLMAVCVGCVAAAGHAASHRNLAPACWPA